MVAYYNEIDPFAAQWLENLIDAGHIAPGVVDRRSIEDISPNELRDFTQCHFFAGIGVWSYALRRAGWGDDRPVWTGSCPCQPFSTSGTGSGFADERHLWPAFFHLISECEPPVIFGEQVASKAVDPWLDLVQNDVEAVGYAFGAVAFPACSVGAPHKRDRTYWVADSERQRTGREVANETGSPGERPEYAGELLPAAWARGGELVWLEGRDGRSRPVEPGLMPVLDGSTQRVGRLRGYGNSIVALQAEEFIRAYLSCDHN